MIGGVVWSACMIRSSLLAAASRLSISMCDWLSLDIRMEKSVHSFSLCLRDSRRALISASNSVGCGGGLGAGGGLFFFVLAIDSVAIVLLHALLRLSAASERVDDVVFGGLVSRFFMFDLARCVWRLCGAIFFIFFNIADAASGRTLR